MSPSPPAPMRNLRQLTGLLHQAADRLRAHGLGPRERIRALRGLYYGARHSLDFERRGSRLRNWGFNLYLQGPAPADPTPLLGARLVRELKDSAVVRHRGSPLDAGHILVGLEARTRFSAWGLPFWGQGGTGLELSTWLGDLGGAAGLLVLRRLDEPAARAVPLLFSADTYDLRANLEGDVAGYLVGRDPGAGPRVSLLPAERFVSVAQALEDYAQAPHPHGDWSRRWSLFARLLGAEAGPAGLRHRRALLLRVRRQTRAFTACYLAYRLSHLGRLSRAGLAQASRHVDGAAAELSELFVCVLEQGLAGAGKRGLPDLPASPPGPRRGWLAWAALGAGD